MSRDVVHFEAGDWVHPHTVDGEIVWVDGRRCEMCGPEKPGAKAVIAGVGRNIGRITVDFDPARKVIP